MRALNLALGGETGANTDPSPEFAVGGIMSEEEGADLMARLDSNRDGRVCWEVGTLSCQRREAMICYNS